MSTNPHILQSSVNTHGTTLDILMRPDIARDPETEALLRTVIEAVMIVFPKDVLNSINESFFETLKTLQSQGVINLARVSEDLYNLARLGNDGGIYVPGRTTVRAQRVSNGSISTVILPLDKEIFNGPYAVSAAFVGDPGTNSRWWIVGQTSDSVTVGFASDNEVPIIVTAQI